MKKVSRLAIACCIVLGLASCGGGSEKKAEPEKKTMNFNTEEAPKKETKAAGADIGDPMTMKGIGPVSSITLGEIDQAMVAEGQELFEANCTACHKVEKKFIGPMIKGVMERRNPVWVMNMILNPEEMIKSDPLAKQVMVESNMAVMANQSLTEDQARKILEYFRTL